MWFRRALPLVVCLCLVLSPAFAAGKKKDKEAEAEEKGPMSAGTFAGLKLRGIGPALMSGRIADIAIPPEDQSTWYVAVGSGNVWKTTNAGTTWETIDHRRPRTGRRGEQVAAFAESSGLDLPFAWDPGGAAHDAFEFPNIPALAVIDRQRRVRLKRVGFNAAETSFAKDLEALLLAL